MKVVFVDTCGECPYMKMGSPPYCVKGSFDVRNLEIIHKDCTLKDNPNIQDDDEPVESGKSLKEVISKKKDKEIEKPKNTTSEAIEESYSDKDDEWWGESVEPQKKTDTSKVCTLCGNPFNGDEITEMDSDDEIIKVHKTCYENIDALVDSSDEMDMIKESVEKKKSEEVIKVESKEIKVELKEIKVEPKEDIKEPAKEDTKEDKDDDWDADW